MSLFWQVLVNGILLGGLYALMALGLALVWGVLNIVNLAHGALIMLGAYVCYFLFTGLGLDPFAALPPTMLALFAFGYLLQRCVLNLVIRAPMFNTLLITFGIDVVLTYLAQIFFSADFRTINPTYAGDNFAFFGATVPLVRLFAFAAALVLTCLLWLFLARARLGRAIRATAQNLTAARLYGVDPRRIYALTFGLGAALAGAAGALYGVVSQVNPYIGGSLTAKSFAIAIIGGLENPLGVIVGGLFLGIVESLTSLYIGPTYADVASFGILVLVLIVRPSGLLGENDLNRRPVPWGAAAAVLAILAAVPWIAPPTLVQFGISTLLLATLAQGWNIIGGYTGYASFGNSVFYGLGSYGTAIAMVQWQWPFAAGLALGAVLAVAFAVLLGLPVLRLRGHYFAIATLALAEVMIAIFSNFDLAGRNIGLVLPLLRGDALFYELSLGLVVLTTLAIVWIARSRFGYGLIAIRENEEAAAVMGVNTTLYKVLAFALSGFFSALAGGIHAYWITFLDPVSAFDIGLNVKMIIMSVFGGPGSILGPVVGAFLLSGVAELLSTEISSLAGLFFGAVIVVAVVFMPRGLADLGRRYKQRGWKYFAENVRAHRL